MGKRPHDEMYVSQRPDEESQPLARLRAVVQADVDEAQKERIWNQLQSQLQLDVTSGKARRRSFTRRPSFLMMTTGVAGAAAILTAAVAVLNGNLLRPPAKWTASVTTKQHTLDAVARPATTPTTPRRTRITAAGMDGWTAPGTTSPSAVSPDGKWLSTTVYLTQHGSAVPSTYLESMSGRRYRVPDSRTRFAIYGSTPFGAVILGYRSLRGVALAYQPGHGIIKRFPGAGATSSVRTYQASQSTAGHWALLVGAVHSPSAAKWLQVDNRRIPSLHGTTAFAWSRDGQRLASIVEKGTSARMMVLDAATKKIIVQRGPFAPLVTQSTSADRPEAQIAWSPDGTMLAWQSADGLRIMKTQKSTQPAIVFPAMKAYNWGWVTNSTLYAVTSGTRTDIRFYRLANAHLTLLGDTPVAGNVTSVRPLPDKRLLVGIHGGAVLEVGMTGARTVAGGIASWWYDNADGRVYFIRKDQPRTVWKVAVPPIAGGIHQ